MIAPLALALFLHAAPAIRPVATRTPGVTRPLSKATICATTWGRDARHVTDGMKRTVAKAYGVPWASRASFEFDHLISRELGGADDVRNLWPQPRTGVQWTAHEKDVLENTLHRLVCAGTVPLAEAQQAIATDWIAAYVRWVKP